MEATQMRILVLESSTASAKAMIYDTSDGSFQVQTRPYTGNYEDVRIHRADLVFEQTAALGRELAAGGKIDIISLSSTWQNVFLADRQLNPVTPVQTWAYTDAAPVCKKLRQDPAFVRDFYHRTGCMVNAIYPAFKLLYLKDQGYRLQDYLIMEQGSYNCFRLTGERVVTQCVASGMGLMNLYTRTFDPEILALIGICEEQLPLLVDSDVNYSLTSEGAALLGLEPGIPVIPSSADGGLNQVGVGAIADGVMTFSVGTSGAIRLTTQEPLVPEHPSTWCYRSPKAYLSGAATNGCCNCIDWFRSKMFPSSMSYSEIEAQVHDRDTTPVFLPFLFGERCPGWNDEGMGSFHEIKPYHTVFDLYRAVQEGVLFNLYHCYTSLTELNGVPRRIKFSGGILHSPEWTQMCADIFQADLEVDNVEHGSMMGAAVLAMEHLGVLKDVRDFVSPPVRIIHPNREKAGIYHEKYNRYLKCYLDNHPLS
jgi:gluconokinase